MAKITLDTTTSDLLLNGTPYTKGVLAPGRLADQIYFSIAGITGRANPIISGPVDFGEVALADGTTFDSVDDIFDWLATNNQATGGAGGSPEYTDLDGDEWDGTNRVVTLTEDRELHTTVNPHLGGKLLVIQGTGGNFTMSMNGTAASPATAEGAKTIYTLEEQDGTFFLTRNTTYLAIGDPPVPDTTRPTMSDPSTFDSHTLLAPMSEAVFGTTAGWSASLDDGVTVTTIYPTGVSGTNNRHLVFAELFLSSHVLHLYYDSATGNTVDGSGNMLATITARAVTNNLPIASAAVYNVEIPNNRGLFLTFNMPYVGTTGFTIKDSSGTPVTISFMHGNGGSRYWYFRTSVFDFTHPELMTISYDDTVGDVADLDGNPLATFTDVPMTDLVDLIAPPAVGVVPAGLTIILQGTSIVQSVADSDTTGNPDALIYPYDKSTGDYLSVLTDADSYGGFGTFHKILHGGPGNKVNKVHNSGRGGSTLADQDGYAPGDYDGANSDYGGSAASNTKIVAIVCAVTNQFWGAGQDAATAYTRLQTSVTRCRTENPGVPVYGSTEICRGNLGSPYEVQLDIFNKMMQADHSFFDGFVDLYAFPAFRFTYGSYYIFEGDGTHLNPKGNRYWAVMLFNYFFAPIGGVPPIYPTAPVVANGNTIELASVLQEEPDWSIVSGPGTISYNPHPFKVNLTRTGSGPITVRKYQPRWWGIYPDWRLNADRTVTKTEDTSDGILNPGGGLMNVGDYVDWIPPAPTGALTLFCNDGRTYVDGGGTMRSDRLYVYTGNGNVYLVKDYPAGFTILASHAILWNGTTDTMRLEIVLNGSDKCLQLSINPGPSEIIVGVATAWPVNDGIPDLELTVAESRAIGSTINFFDFSNRTYDDVVVN